MRLIPACLFFAVLVPALPAQNPDAFKTFQGPVQQWTYEMATGTWLHQPLPDRYMGGATAALGPKSVYDNTISSGVFYLGASAPGQLAVDAGNLAVTGVSGADQVDCVRIAYATTSLTSPSVDIHLWNLYGPGDGTGGLCSGWGVTNPADLVISVSGLPPSASGNAEGFVVAIDLQGSGFEPLMDQRGTQGTAPLHAPVFAYAFDYTDLVTGPIIAGDPSGGLDNGDAFERINADLTVDCLSFGGWPANPWGGFFLELLAMPTDIRAIYDSLGANNLGLFTQDEAILGSPMTLDVTGIPSDNDSVAVIVSIGFQETPLQGFVLFNTAPFVLPRHSSLPVTHSGGVGSVTKVVPLHWTPGKVIYAQAVAVDVFGSLTGASNALQMIK